MSNSSLHKISAYIKIWLLEQPAVKEESLTDWFLRDVSRSFNNVRYYAFTRHVEAENGADWEWWVLTRQHAFRFRVQAKKLKKGKNNRSLILYRDGIQINRLRDHAQHDGAYPLYAFYSATEPFAYEQQDNYSNWFIREAIDWCRGCENGVFLAPLALVSKLILKKVAHETSLYVSDTEILNHSIKLSSFDYFEKYNAPDFADFVEKNLLDLNASYAARDDESDMDIRFAYSYTDRGEDGARVAKNVPGYLKVLLQSDEMPGWFLKEYAHWLPTVDGISIIDLRQGD